MKRVCVVLVGTMIIFRCACAQAAREPGHDPQVIIAGGGGSFPVGNIFQILSPSGTSPLNLLGGSACVILGIQIPDCIFQNGTTSTWSSLTFSISPGHQIGPFVCLALAYFSKCSFNKMGTSVTFSDGQGIAPGEDFLVVVLLWLPETTFAGTATESDDSAARVPIRRAQPRYSERSTLTLFLNCQPALMEGRRLRTADGSVV